MLCAFNSRTSLSLSFKCDKVFTLLILATNPEISCGPLQARATLLEGLPASLSRQRLPLLAGELHFVQSSSVDDSTVRQPGTLVALDNVFEIL